MCKTKVCIDQLMQTLWPEALRKPAPCFLTGAVINTEFIEHHPESNKNQRNCLLGDGLIKTVLHLAQCLHTVGKPQEVPFLLHLSFPCLGSLR